MARNEEKKIEYSIHPRVVKSVQVHEKVNTSKRANPDIIRKKIESMGEHMGRHPKDGSTSSHISKLQTKLNAL